MWKNYLKIAWRNLRRNKGYAVINVGGLAVGLATFLIASLYVQHELSYDRFHENSECIYRVVSNMDFGGRAFREAYTPAPFAPSMERSFSEVEEAVRIKSNTADSIFYQNTVFHDIGAYYAGGDIFSVFSFDLIAGNPATALRSPYSIVLTESLAERIFGKTSPLGQTVMLSTGMVPSWEEAQPRPYEVTGVMADVPATSHLPFDVLISFETLKDPGLAMSWGMFQYTTYLLLAPGTERHDFEAKLPAFAQTKHGEDWTRERNLHYELEPLSAVYFSPVPAPRQGDIRYVWAFSTIALVVLLIVCGNYVNLAVARSASRTQEVGVRKVMGARRMQLIRQFLSESLLLTLLAFPLSLLVMRAALPFIRNLIDARLQFALFENGWFILVALGVVGLAGLLAGSYPAFFLSRFEPADVLRDRLQRRFSSGKLRRLLIVLQFAASAALIFGTATIFRQLDYMQSKDLGLNEEQVVTIRVGQDVSRRIRTLKQELENQPSITAVAVTDGIPNGRDFGGGGLRKVPWLSQPIDTRSAAVGYGYFDVLDIELIAGRSFSEARPSDASESVIINETAARRMGLGSAREAIGREVGGDEIIGVAKDFHYASLHKPIEPVFLSHRPGRYHRYDALLVRIEEGKAGEALAEMQQVWKKFVPSSPFHYSFLKEEIEQLYEKERNAAQLMTTFSMLAVLLACLGVLGLASYAVARRTKEVGIRKALGASAANIVMLLSKDFAKLVLVANVVALPLGYLAMRQWLQDFAYHVTPSIWLFTGTCLVSLALALATVSSQAVKAAFSNPVDAIRYE